MKLFEIFEDKSTKQIAKSLTPRNFVSKNAPKTGAGSHTDKKYTRKEKYKNVIQDE